MRSTEQQISLEEKLRFFCRKTADILRCDRCSVWFYNTQKTAIRAGFIYQKNSDVFLDGATIIAKDVPDYFEALESKVVIDATDAEIHPATHEFKDIYLKPLGIKSMLDIPLIQAENSIGVICSEYVDKTKIFADHEISFARSVADVIVLAYETEQLKISQIELKEKNESLNAAMEKLVGMQEDLVQHEKMATLGLLIAGIAHEINTPLGAIKASNENLQTGLLNLLNEQFRVISPETLNMSVKLFALAKKESKNISTREERQQIKKIEEQIVTLFPHITNTNFFGRKLFDLGFDDVDSSLIEFVNHPENETIFNFSADLLKLIKSTYTIGLAAEKAGKVVKALNTFSHGNIENEISSFNLNENIESVITLLWNRIKYNTKVHNLISSEVILTGNAEELSQIWTNIINNALQAANNNCNIWIDYAKDESHHLISIANDGPPIPENILPKIFETFFSTKKRGEGTGLGLSIVKKIIEKHNGKIICESNPEKTTFVIYLPINT
jgi:signal transduction histidine kinase